LFSKRYLNHHFTQEKIQNGFSTIDLSITIAVIGILATILAPNFSSALEYFEVLIGEKQLYSAVKECQQGLINDEISPNYNLPAKELSLGIYKNNKYSFDYTGVENECFTNNSSNRIRLTRAKNNQSEIQYALIIDLITGERISEGDLPEWLDWWEDFYSPLIPENDPLLYEY
tara:strand:- start:136 stop:654 length:519 start_codon:yes stop_codon:yes gene_type:complete